MSTERDVTRALRSWLHEDAHEDADRVLALVLDQLDATPQRRAAWPARRFLTMSNIARLGLAAAAIIVAVVVGIELYSRLSVGPPGPSPSSAPTPVALSSPPVALNAGVRYLDSSFSVPFTFSVPGPGWTVGTGEATSFGVHASANGYYGLSIMTDVSIYRDPCHWDLGYIDNLTSLDTVDGVVAAMTSFPGFTASTSVASTVDGHAGMAFDLTVPTDASTCKDPGKVRVLDVGGSNDEFTINGHLHYQVIDVGGTPVVLEHYSFAGASMLPQVQQVADTIKFP